MSQFVLDDQLWVVDVRDRIRRWSIAEFMRDLRPGEVIKDERVPSILRALRTPTFVTIDTHFRDRTLRDDEQGDIPSLLRRVLRLPEFRTRAARMGKVARVSRERVIWWQLGDDHQRTRDWAASPRRVRG